jgi:hypothetical protein
VKFSLRLADADRARYDCPEWIDVDPFAVSVREAMILQTGVTVTDGNDGFVVQFASPGAWRKAMAGTPVLDAEGKPVLVDVLDDEGQPVIDEATGKPKQKPLKQNNYLAQMVLVWLALRRAGVSVSLKDLVYDTDQIAWKMVADEPDADEPGVNEPGEAPATDPLGKDPSSPPTTSEH